MRKLTVTPIIAIGHTNILIQTSIGVTVGEDILQNAAGCINCAHRISIAPFARIPWSRARSGGTERCRRRSSSRRRGYRGRRRSSNRICVHTVHTEVACLTEQSACVTVV